MRKYLLLPLTAACLLLPSRSAHAQCGGFGPATLEFISVDNQPIGPGSKIVIRLTGIPNTYLCLICDLGAGPSRIPGIGTVCLDLGVNAVEFVAQLPASGVLDIPLTLPASTSLRFLCCQWFGVGGRPLTTTLSNAVCLTLGTACEGGVHELGHLTRFDVPASFPVTVTSSATGTQGKNSHAFKTDVSFDPNNPPSFPVTDDNHVFIEKISIVDGKLEVLTRVDAGKDSRDRNARLNNNVTFTVQAGNARNEQVIHCSCSQPLGVGMVFGPFRITSLVSR